MKFGRNLPRNQVPEWSAEYINYKGLKKLIKSSAELWNEEDGIDLAGFFFSLDRNLESVDGFYNKKYADAARRLRLLYERYGSSTQTTSEQREESEDLIGALLELRSQLRKLQWYGEVNRRGFVKITKKLDKKVATACAQQRYLMSRVDPRPFATNARLSQDMNSINTWLSKLGDAKPKSEESGSSRSSFSLTRCMSKIKLALPDDLVQMINQAILQDDAVRLESGLESAQEYGNQQSEPFQRLLLNHFYRAITARAMKCMSILLRDIISLDEEDDLNKRNCFHRIIVGVGKSRSTQIPNLNGFESSLYDTKNTIVPAEAPVFELFSYGVKEVDSSRPPDEGDDTAQLVTFLLSQLSVQQRGVLQNRDAFGRMPLHYAAKYGFVSVSQVLVERMVEWNLLDLSAGFESAKWQDLEGNSPVHLAVIGGWRLTTETILKAFGLFSQTQESSLGWGKSSLLLGMASKANFYNIVKLLINAGADVNFQDEQGETALHLAAHRGHVESAKALLAGSERFVTDLNIPEKLFGWTPLLVASVDGQLAMVETLIDAGADVDRLDSSGWSAQEHAALRGHIDIAELLAKHITKNPSPGPETMLSSSLPKTSSLTDRSSNISGKDNRTIPSVKSFGHRYLTDESMILVSLGSMDTRKNIKPVDLDNIPYAEAHATQLDTALSIVVSASDAGGEPTIIDLPVQDSINTEPIVFTTKDISKVKLLFDIVPTYAGTKEQVVGRGVALLSSIKTSIGSKRVNLQGDISVPIVAAKTLDILGSVNFNFIIVKPFSHPNMSVTETKTYWKSLTAPMVIGHRGLGKNSTSRKSLQLGENTIQSFIAAANLGATYVEFDVQLTKDHVPVIYHDFLVSETGIDAPVHTLTLEQFLHINDSNTIRPSRPSSPTRRTHISQSIRSTPARSRANSLGSLNDSQSSDMVERMKHTRDMKLQGYKGNSRGNFIQAPFTTLEEMLRLLPEHIGFNIEMKYPMLSESEEHEMDTYAVELNSFVDTVLKMVYDLAGKRNFIFSSFHPDVCLLLSLKQPSIPILFLTDAGTCPVGDIRATSLQEAIRFASRWNLLGIVASSEPLVLCPRLVRVVKESGLVCVSYGTLNNEPKNVQLQVNEGIDAVIVDSVLAIRKGLTVGEKLQDGAKNLAATGAIQNCAVAV